MSNRATNRNACPFCDDAADKCAARGGHNLVDTTDPAAFWRALSPAEALALLKVRPKVAGPWQPDGGSANSDLVRLGADGERLASVYLIVAEWRVRTLGHLFALPTRQKATDTADAALRAAGWQLVDEKEAKPHV